MCVFTRQHVVHDSKLRACRLAQYTHSRTQTTNRSQLSRKESPIFPCHFAVLDVRRGIVCVWVV